MSVEISTIIGLIIGAFVIGFVLRSAQIKKLKRKVEDLEREMMASHAEILELQKDKLVLEEKLKGSSSIPVISITSKEDKKADKLQDKSIGKK
jgi:predicted Holliday junction resolvase-like endonuclease